MLQGAEDSHYVTANYVLELTKRAYELFKSSEVEEKRQLIKLTLQNLRLEGKTLRYEAVKPFDSILDYADRQAWLAKWDDYRKGEWLNLLDSPELILQQTHQLLSL